MCIYIYDRRIPCTFGFLIPFDQPPPPAVPSGLQVTTLASVGGPSSQSESHLDRCLGGGGGGAAPPATY